MNTHIITKFTVIFNLESKCCHLCLFEWKWWSREKL